MKAHALRHHSFAQPWQHTVEAIGSDMRPGIEGVVGMEQERSRTLYGLAENVRLFFEAPSEYDAKALKKVMNKNDGWSQLAAAKEMLAAHEDWSPAALEDAVRLYCEAKEAKLGHVAQPLRVALAGRAVSPPIHETLATIGKDETLRRIDALLATQPAG